MMLRSATLLSLPSLALGASLCPAQAQDFTNHDGYAGNGAYRVQLELSPALWLPAAHGSAAPAGFTAAPHPAFTGGGLLRYGPYSTELDVQYVSNSDSKTLPDSSARLGASYVRVAPGLGYQLYKGTIFSIPASLDARAGFAYFEDWQTLQGYGNSGRRPSSSDNFVQPWVGTRIDFIPRSNLRLELTALVQGMGADHLSWGAAGIISYAISDWCAVGVGYKAQNTAHNGGPGIPKEALNLTAYGPMLGVTFRFGNAPPPPPAP